MGLAPYGNQGSEQVEKFKEVIYSHLIDVKSDGSLWMNQSYFDYTVGLTMIKDKKWQKLFGFERRKVGSNIEQHHSNMALAIQQITEDIIIKMAKEAKKITSSKYLCLADGVALNCVANGKLVTSDLFEKVFIQPASGDAGGSLGAALAIAYQYFGQRRNTNN